MVTYKRAREFEYTGFLQLMRQTTGTDYELVLNLMGMDWEGFAHRFRTTGQVYGIYENDDLAGFYWVEMREDTLHLHGLIVSGEFQRKGIGTEVLHKIESEYGDLVSRIELGVDQANTRAKALYERLGYHVVKTLDDVDFCVMQKVLANRKS
ncbi:MAG TPA: GNAT family N-acetyltransferase [Anaerolineales bacterium]